MTIINQESPLLLKEDVSGRNLGYKVHLKQQKKSKKYPFAILILKGVFLRLLPRYHLKQAQKNVPKMEFQNKAKEKSQITALIQKRP